MDNKIVAFVAIILAVFLLSNCDLNSSGSSVLKAQALNYFTQKYNIDKSDIKVEKNLLYDKDKRCLDSCGDNVLRIEYKNTKYTIYYDAYKDIFGDNYQLKEIYEGLNKYLESKFPYATAIRIDNFEADVTGNSVKYEGDIETYFKTITNRRYTYANIWLKADDAETAKELHNKYAKEMCTLLDEIGLSYNIAFSIKQDDNEYSAYYYYHVFNDNVYFRDRVDNQRKHYTRQVPYPIDY